jgi:hypothetical protein
MDAEPTAPPSPIASRQTWRHAFGEAVIEICEDGTVLIDGKVVRDTLPGGPGNPIREGRVDG